jgi:hypothetical protein
MENGGKLTDLFCFYNCLTNLKALEFSFCSSSCTILFSKTIKDQAQPLIFH